MTGTNFDIEFPPDYFDRGEVETPSKGWLPVTVILGGERYSLTFYDPVRLQQSLDDIVSSGRGVHFSDPGLVIVPEVTTANIRRAVADLVAEGFFLTLRAGR
jgi:hypothetical protein